MNIINTNNGSDFSSVKPCILVDISGNSISNPGVNIIDTNNGTDFSSCKIAIILNTSGNTI